MNLIENRKLKTRGLSLGEFYSGTEFEVDIIAAWNAAVVHTAHDGKSVICRCKQSEDHVYEL